MTRKHYEYVRNLFEQLESLEEFQSEFDKPYFELIEGDPLAKQRKYVVFEKGTKNMKKW